VTNTNNNLQGQLLGNCINLTASNSYTNAATLCLAVSSNIIVNSAFTVRDFALRTGSSTADYTYRPQGKTTTTSGSTLCATVTANGWYCPIMRTTDYSTATSDAAGSSLECPALDRLVAQAQLSQECAAGDVSACATVNQMNNVTTASSSSGSTFTFGTAPPTAAPTVRATNVGETPAPTSSPKRIEQSVTLTTVSITEFNNPAVKEVYEVAYGLTLGIYDATTQAYKTGCSVASTAAANRRAGITVSYAATVSHAETTAAESASTALASNPAAFTNQVSAAQTHVAATSTHDTSALSTMTVPTASDVQAAAPVVITEAPTAAPITEAPTAAPITNEDLENAMGALLLYIIIAAAVGLVCVVGIIVACCCCCAAAAGSGAQQPAGKAEVQMTSAPGVKNTSSGVPPAAPLPAGWVANVDPASGKTFYVAPDQSTHWELPGGSQA